MKIKNNNSPQQETKTTYFKIVDRFSKKHLNQFSKETLLAMQAALNAALAVKTVGYSSLVEIKKGVQNYSTAGDLASEKKILTSIAENFPADPILSEETHSGLLDPLTYKRLWVIDPIDGTVNARHDRGYSAISIGFVKKGKPYSGAIYDLSRDELFYAESGKGAFLNDRRIKVSSQNNIKDAAVSTDWYYDHSITLRHLGMLKKSGSALVYIRGSAVLAMAQVACGRDDLYFHTAIRPWDNAAAFALIENAGGIIMGLDGRKIDIMSRDIVVGNKTLVNQFISRMKK